jgi:phage FluMu gp28-like protein
MQNRVEIRPPNLVPYQLAILNSLARFTITEAATKTGKTFSHLWWLFEQANIQPQPKNGANYWWVAPVYAQAKIAFTRLRRVVALSGKYRINESELFIETPNGSRIWFKSAEKPDNLYGEDVFAIVFDEFTRAREEAWIAIRTTLTSTRGKCKLIGNVKGKKNWGYKLGMKARAGNKDYEYFRITAMDAVNEGLLDAEEIEQARRDLPEHAFKELYLAEALDDQANPFGIQFINNQVKELLLDTPACFGIDLAKSVDWTVVTGLNDEGDICFFERWQSDWGQTRSRIIRIVGSTPAYIDSTGVGDPIAEDIRKECANVENYHFTSQSKQKLMEGLASGLQNSKVSVLDGIMKEELESFEFQYSRTGVTYSSPDGSHDDCVCSLALAYQKLSEGVSLPYNYVTFH